MKSTPKKSPIWIGIISVDPVDARLSQTTNTVIMVTPSEFDANPEAGADNHFSNPATDFDKEKVLQEAARLRDALRSAGVRVIEIDPTLISPRPKAPDACFPNNWLMFVDGIPVLCPMKAVSRRRERAMWPHIRERLIGEGLSFGEAVDLSAWEDEGLFLEGTGSLVLDRVNQIAYAALSERTSRAAAERFAEMFGYRLFAFEAADPQGRAIYHTNVILSIGTEFAVLCPEAIHADSLPHLQEELSASRTVVEITWEQALQYCGNVLELTAAEGSAVAMSQTAYDAFSPQQLQALSGPVIADISTIEHVAGGSVRCMLAEVFCPSASPCGSK